jgi:hypothetical protein
LHLGLCTEVYNKDLEISLSLLNLYGLDEGKENFWDNLYINNCLWSDNLIIRGNLNFTLNREEIWRLFSREDSLSNYFINKFELVEWVDVKPTQIFPTWSNNKVDQMGSPRDSICSWLIM